MVETLTGTNRSKGISYNELLDMDTHQVPAQAARGLPDAAGADDRSPQHLFLA